jgi:hypothetical protein
MSDTFYKINYIINEKIDTIYVFYGKPVTANKKKEIMNSVFNETELARINADNATVKFSEQLIHFDDSIGTIKLKILVEFNKSISLEEIYLFCNKYEELNAISLYQSLTQNKKLDLTKIRLDQFLVNIVSDENGNAFKSPTSKEVYTFDDILEMKINGKKYIVNKVLGQKFFIVENEYPFVCNPYNVYDFDNFFERVSRHSLTTLNNRLLLNSDNILDNNIYLCVASDVLKFAVEKSISQETIIKVYYPFLYNKNINDLDDLTENREMLIANNNTLLNDKTLKLFKTIDMFYGVYNLRKNELNYVNKGIKYIKGTIVPGYDLKIPLEIIFKVIHASKTNPLIKYNPASRQENIYRLYTDNTSTDGRKIPFLKKSQIFKLMRNMGKIKSVSIYIEHINGENVQPIICEFMENGFITFSAELETVIDVSDVEQLLRDSVNPLINEISKFLEQSGYKLNKFTSLSSDNVEINNISYESQIKIIKRIELEPFKSCISSVFNNESSEFKSGVHLRFKRVSNFNRLTSQEAFILEKSEQGYRGNDIIEALLDNFKDDLNREQAEDLVRKVANEIQVERGVRKSTIKIKDNPGFKTTIMLEQSSGIITIMVENINDINYLTTIPIYLDTMIRLTQNKGSTKYLANNITKLCSGDVQEEIIINDIVSPESDNQTMDEEDIEQTIEEREKPTGAFNLFFDEEEEEDDMVDTGSNSIKGGMNDDSSDEELTYRGLPIPNGIDEDTDSSVATDVGNIVIEKQDAQSDKSDSSVATDVGNIVIEKQDAQSDKSDSSVATAIENEIEEEPVVEEVEEEPVVEEVEEEPVAEEEEPVVEEVEEGESDEEIEEPGDEVKNIDGLKLNKPYYFQSLIEKYDPVLILKEDTPQFNAYSRTCSSDTRRQPVILTDTQLNKINKEHKGFLRDEDVIKYGSDPNNKFNYICPRYWCLKNNTIIDPAELKEVIGKDGKKELMHPTCGKVLARGDKKVKPGYYIYEFYKPKKDGQNRYPGFQTGKHPDGFCLPCCFDKYNTEGRIQAKKECSGEPVKEGKAKKVDEKEDEYIKGPDKFPLDPGRWGYLPPEIQSVLREVNADCQISKTNTNLKQNHPCLLRHGVQLNKNQSFIACISDVIFFAKPNVDKSRGTAEILSIKDMRERIIKSLTIDMFIKYQNGNLVTDFKSYTDQVSDKTMKKYNTSDLYNKIKTDEELFYFKTVITAFENFIQFLSDDNAIIDHTYLWDIICMPNRYLFPSGVNLVIFKLPHDDITNNVQLLCPTNHYSTQFYQARKPTIILIKEGEFYEPIYSYTTNANKLIIAKEFKEYDPQLSQTMRAVIKEIIKPVLNTLCKPLMSMPTIKVKQALLPHAIIEHLETYKYRIKKYVMNFNNKIIGIIAEEPFADGITGFIPCYPSVIHDIWENNPEFVFMTDKTLWNNYDDTIKFLTNLYKRSKKKRPTADIPCNPILKVVEDNMVVGILTETNQFVQLSTPISELEIASSNDIPSLRNNNYIVNSKTKTGPMVNVDVNISTTNDVDNDRIDYIQRIKMETNFYNVFRNTIRILLNDYNNIKLREKIELLLKNNVLIYSEKLNKVDALLKELVNETIQFNGDENYYKLIKDISTCIVKNKDECGKADNLCAVTRDDHCNLILPEKNLMTHKENRGIYFGKMADELIRYSRVNQFMFQPQTYLSFGKVQYNLREDEIILLQSLLTQEYFDGLVPVVINKYVTNNSYDEVEPVITQVYDNTFKLPTNATGLNCTTVLNKITSATWSKCFPKKFKELSYSSNVHCTFQIIIDIIERKTKHVKTISDIKHELYKEYKVHLDNKHRTKIVDILILEGKKTLGDQVKAETLLFDDFIYASNYFLTPLDLWLLVNKFQIPTIFISSKNILQTNYAKQTFVGHSTQDFMNDAFVFIVIPGLKNEQVPEFKLIIDESNNYLIPINKLHEECIDKIRNAMDNKQNINEYLDTFIKPKMKSTKRETNLEEDIKPQTFKKMPKKKSLTIMPDSEEPIAAAPTKTKRSKITLKGRTQTKKLKIIEDQPVV